MTKQKELTKESFLWFFTSLALASSFISLYVGGLVGFDKADAHINKLIKTTAFTEGIYFLLLILFSLMSVNWIAQKFAQALHTLSITIAGFITSYVVLHTTYSENIFDYEIIIIFFGQLLLIFLLRKLIIPNIDYERNHLKSS